MKTLLSFVLSFALVSSQSVYRNDSERQIYCHAPNAENCIALTFDDGPHPQYTEEILAILEEYGVKATFFTIGENVTQYPEVLEKILEQGHEVGNHTFSHPHLQKKGSAALTEELERTERLLMEKGVGGTKLFRPPEGVCSDAVCETARKMGYAIILWTVDTKDWRHTPSQQIADAVTAEVKSGDIILFHDYVTKPSPTPAALRRIIPTLLDKGYRFVTVSELIGLL